jgi:hypothetical protein
VLKFYGALAELGITARCTFRHPRHSPRGCDLAPATGGGQYVIAIAGGDVEQSTSSRSSLAVGSEREPFGAIEPKRARTVANHFIVCKAFIPSSTAGRSFWSQRSI